jgi:predicted ATPase/DNA-binding CsgD family transcriptional regulator
MADRSGQQLGNYRLLRLLGRGGFAEVYLGQHIYLNSQAALKVLQIALNDEDIEHFAKEARTLASLTHPHIIRVLDYAVENGTPFLVMEYAANGTLRQRYPHGTRLPVETIISYVRQVASALQYAHDQRLIHRDIKPENMLLGATGEILLSDFGLAMPASHTVDQSTQAMEISFAGTTPYLAPEQLQGKPQPASDQYSLAVVVYEWLCGKRPFNGSPLEIAMQHISVPPPPLHEQIAGISPSIEETVMGALAKDPQQRFASVQDFAIALERAYQYTSLPQSSFAPSIGSEALGTILKPGPMWKVPPTFTPLIGRDKEVAEICELLKHPEVRLLTLLGTGGIGKTRLSYQIAREMQPYFADGVCLVPMATVNEPDLVVPTIAQVLGIQEIGAQPILEQVKVVLRSRHFLLLLDNFEQVVTAAPLIEEILEVCPRLKVVVTSREVLHLQAEREFPVPPLGLPNLNQLPEDEALTQYAAVALFVQRARASLPTFQLTRTNAHAVAEICVRLDGLPLAIELAAARIKVLPPQALLARLSQLFQVLTGGARTLPLRHQTLHNALQWSYDLLDGKDQRLFRRLSVFAGGWTLEAVEALEKTLNEDETSTLSVLDGVASLLDKSLLVQRAREGKEPRLIMLRTVREYALELLRESGESEPCQRAHALYFLTFVEEVELHLKRPQQTTWLEQLERERANLRAALAWLIEHEEAELALRFCGALWWFWYLRGYWSEGRRWLEGALGLAQAESSTAARAKALYGAGNLAYYQDDYAAGRLLLEESIEIYRKLENKRELASALGALGVLVHLQGDLVTARPLLEESEMLLRTLGSKWELAYLLRKLGQRTLQEGNLAQAVAYAQEGLALAREQGDRSLIATALLTLGNIATVQGDLTQAVSRNREGLTMARELGDKSLIALALQNLGYLASLQGNLTRAVVRAREGLALARELGDKSSINHALHSLGYIASLQGDTKQAAAWFQEGLSLAQEIRDETQVGWHLIGLASIAAAEGQPVRAARLYGAAETRLNVNVSMNDVELADYTGKVESVRGKLGEKIFTAAWAEGRSMTPEQALAAPEKAPAPVPHTSVSPPAAPTYPDGLTAREVEVLQLLAAGKTVAEIAERLVISPRTVTTHITTIYRKIQVSTRSAATRYAIEQKLV